MKLSSDLNLVDGSSNVEMETESSKVQFYGHLTFITIKLLPKLPKCCEDSIAQIQSQISAKHSRWLQNMSS